MSAHGGASGMGRVWLVGAGPGDPELLTVKAVRAIASADVVLYDALVDRRVLAYAPAGARCIPVGKRGGAHSTSQAFIHHLMLREARAGRRVVRLKGGDPFVFGRGAEELAVLREHGVPVDVIPGITSGLGAAAAAELPVTHRAYAHGVAFVTGHPAEPGEGARAGSSPNWRALAQSGLTVVIYMGLRRGAALQQDLFDAGFGEHTPVAVIANATRPDQHIVRSSLKAYVEECARAAMRGPAIIVLGEVARVNAELVHEAAARFEAAGARICG